MKIALLILILFIIILIIIYFQYKPIQTFENNRCLLTDNQLQNIINQKNNIQLISELINNVYDIATRLNNNSIEKKLLAQTPTTNTDLYNQALANYNASSMKRKLDLILDDKNIINNFYNDKLEYYNKQILNCR
jgi:hypothetical protein